MKSLNPSSFAPKEGRKAKKGWILLSGVLLAGLSVLIYFLISSPQRTPPSTDSVTPLSSQRQEPQPQDAEQQVVEGSVKKKSTLFKSLGEKNIPASWIDVIVSKLKPYVNFKRIKGGTYRFVADGKGDLVKFTYEAGPTEIYEIDKSPQGYTVQRKEVPLETYVVKIVGEIRSSLFEAMDEIGEQDRLVLDFAEILAWEIDFYKDVKEGDRFKIVVEKVYKGDEFIRYGAVHAVEYQRGEKTLRGIAFQNDYYNEQGISLRKAFLKAPLRFNRISSTFSRARRHPILGGMLPHYGVDYAAPSGTPVWAVADGTVVSRGWAGGFGKQVILRHMNGYTTHYGHLSSYGPGINRGTHVSQKQIIGTVGSSGLSTGPHLDYRLAKDGRFRNPMKESFPTGVPIRAAEMERFERTRDQRVAWLEGNTPLRERIGQGESSP